MSGFDPPGDPILDELAQFTDKQIELLAQRNPALYARFQAVVRVSTFLAEREQYENDFISFMRRAWQEIDTAPISINWHHVVVADHLEAITFGRLRNVVINIPPRCSKSLEVNVLWPAWIWAQPPHRKAPLSGPHVSFLCVSYGSTLAEEIAVKMRRLVMGDWYQSLWGDRVRIMEDQQSRANFATTAGGERISASVEGGILGRGGDIQILDDVISPGEANSQLERERVMRAISEGLATRVKNPQTAARVMVMQRLHMEDPTSYALETWRPRPVHLMFPMRYEPERASSLDPRTYDGELLWPEVWDEESVAKTEIDLGDYGSAAQFQQSPIPRGGGIISPSDWNIWPEWVPKSEDMMVGPGGQMFVPLPDSISHVVVSLDTALSERETADWNACIAFAIWHRPRKLTQIVGHQDNIDDGEQPRVIMMGGWQRRCKLNDDEMDRDGMAKGLVQRVVAFCRRFNADRLLIENKTRGLDVANEIQRQIQDMPFQIQFFNPQKHGDKVARLHAIQPLFSQGLIYAPANCTRIVDRAGNESVHVGEFAWCREIFNQIEQVPRGAHDDYADATAQALLTLRDEGYLALTREYVAEQMRVRMFARRSERIREGYGV